MDLVKQNCQPLEAMVRTVSRYALPNAFYDHDLGEFAYATMLFLELPFRAGQELKNLYYHTRHLEHEHI